MKKVNFNNLDNIEIPDSWAEKAIGIPSALENKRKVTPIPKFYRNIAYAACFVLVCALSVSLFIFTQKGDILKAQSPTEHVIETVNSNTYPQNETTLKESQPPTVSQTDSIASTEEPTEEDTKDDGETGSNSLKPNHYPTKPQLRPTLAPDPPKDEEDPTTDVVNPDGPSSEPQGNKKCIGVFPEDLLSGDYTVYFSIVSTDLESTESLPLYEATIESVRNGEVSASFSPIKAGLIDHSGTYDFYFYNSNYEIIYVGQTYFFLGG